MPSNDIEFENVEIFRFGNESRQAKDILQDDPTASRWLSISAPFPIPEPNSEIVYPTIEHFMIAMKFKSSNTPDRSKELASNAILHQKYTTVREKLVLESKEYFDSIIDESKEVKNKISKESFAKTRTVVDDTQWVQRKDVHLKYALTYRWEHDRRFRNIVEVVRNRRVLRNRSMYMLFSTNITELGGTHSPTTKKIQGENKVGRFIMEIAGFQFNRK